LFYTTSLICIIAYKYTSWFDPHYTTSIELLAVLSVITLLFVAYHWKSLAGFLSLKKVRWKPLLAIMAISCAFGTGLFFLQEYLNALNHNAQYRISLIFWESPYPKLYSVLFLCVQPAVIEELAFRGFIFNSLLVRYSARISMIVSSLLFALLHLSLVSVLWLFPIGWLFVYFRHHYQSLWYGIFGHFTYNFMIIFLEINRYWGFLM